MEEKYTNPLIGFQDYDKTVLLLLLSYSFQDDWIISGFHCFECFGENCGLTESEWLSLVLCDF